MTGFAGRMERATNNSLLALTLVAPAVLLTELAESALIATDSLMLIFVLARIAYVALYALDISWFRTAAWLVGFLSTTLLYLGLVA